MVFFFFDIRIFHVYKLLAKKASSQASAPPSSPSKIVISWFLKFCNMVRCVHAVMKNIIVPHCVHTPLKSVWNSRLWLRLRDSTFSSSYSSASSTFSSFCLIFLSKSHDFEARNVSSSSQEMSVGSSGSAIKRQTD